MRPIYSFQQISIVKRGIENAAFFQPAASNDTPIGPHVESPRAKDDMPALEVTLPPMSTPPAKPLESVSKDSQLKPVESGTAKGVIAWSSFFFALLQSICTFFAAVDGLRVVIGIGSLAVSTWIGTALDRFHSDWIRVPMIGLALLGALLNLAVLAQVRYLRNRPASQWRQKPLSQHKIRMERVQVALSVATLALIAIEEYLHFGWSGHL
jgi:hypothetical protein